MSKTPYELFQEYLAHKPDFIASWEEEKRRLDQTSKTTPPATFTATMPSLPQEENTTGSERAVEYLYPPQSADPHTF